MIQIFDKHMNFVREISDWDPALCPNNGYAVGSSGMWIHKFMDRLSLLAEHELEPQQKAYNLLMGK